MGQITALCVSWYHEVPQASTGFSPFELLYGRAVRGPLDILRETWEVSEKSSESVISHVLNMREKLEKMSELAQENLAAAQVKQKSCTAGVCEFQPGDQVLVLLPTSTQKLYAQWQGPYQIVKRKDYVVDMHDRRKKHRLFHVNMLKQFVSPPACMYVSEVQNGEVDEERSHRAGTTHDWGTTQLTTESRNCSIVGVLRCV